MNQESKQGGDGARDAEWLRQERARELERGAPGSAGDTARVQRYRLVVRSLAQPLEHALPSNFAHATSLASEKRLAQRRQQDRVFRRRLQGGMLVVYITALLAAAVAYLPAWMPALWGLVSAARLPAPWLVATVACLAVSWLVSRRKSWRRR